MRLQSPLLLVQLMILLMTLRQLGQSLLWRRDARRLGPSQQGLSTSTPSVWHMPSGWKSLRWGSGIRYSIQMVMVLSVSSNRWTAQARASLVKNVYAVMLVSLRLLTKPRWRHGLGTMLGTMLDVELNGKWQTPDVCPTDASTKATFVVSSVQTKSWTCRNEY